MTTWQTDPATGLVTVDFGDGVGPHIPVLSTGEATNLKSHVLEPWGQLIAMHADEVGVPPAHMAGLIYRESDGNANVIASDGGVGLMQITSKVLKAGHTDSQLTDPELNIQIGSTYFGTLWHQYNGDLPRAAAAYNAGSARPCSTNTASCNQEWGLVATKGHITSVVSASNTIIQNGWVPDALSMILDPTLNASIASNATQSNSSPASSTSAVASVSQNTFNNIMGFILASSASFTLMRIYGKKQKSPRFRKRV